MKMQYVKNRLETMNIKRRGGQNSATWITAIAAVVSSCAVVTAFGTFLWQWFVGIDLEIKLPPVIEFRCSSVNFDSVACFQGNAYMTVTAGFSVIGKGAQIHQAAIEESEVIFTIGSNPKTYRLTALWSADFVPGQEFNRRQVVSTSVRGGQHVTQEIWFFPLPKKCAKDGQNKKVGCKEERDNFLEWTKFRNMLLEFKEKPEKDLKKIIELTFLFTYRKSSWIPGRSLLLPKEVKCTVEIGESVYIMAEKLPQKDPLYITSPCYRSY